MTTTSSRLSQLVGEWKILAAFGDEPPTDK